MLNEQVIDDAINQFHDEGYAIVRNFLPETELAELQEKTAELREIALEHPVTYRHGNLTYEILPEEHFGKRFVIQAYWFAWADAYFDRFRSNPRYLQLLEPLIGRNVKQVTQQIHWKPPGARLTGYRFHQDLLQGMGLWNLARPWALFCDDISSLVILLRIPLTCDLHV